MEFEFVILYLTGVDLQMSVEVEGLKVSDESNYTSESSKLGRYIRFFATVHASDFGKAIKLLIIDKKGKVVEEFPLVVA